jgi:Flp pilus assembly protein TadD
MNCWLDRAVRFAPDDGQVRMLLGVYLLRAGQKEEAVKELESARELVSVDDPNLHYNLGLAYFDLGRFDQSLFHAHKAYELGFPLPGLKNKLVRANRWREPENRQ